MHCTVGVVRTRVEGPKQYTISVPPSDMGQNLKYLLESEIGSDITFQVGDEAFKAHKLILAARSPVFRAQFFGLIGDPNKEIVELADIEPSIFKVIINFFESVPYSLSLVLELVEIVQRYWHMLYLIGSTLLLLLFLKACIPFYGMHGLVDEAS